MLSRFRGGKWRGKDCYRKASGIPKKIAKKGSDGARDRDRIVSERVKQTEKKGASQEGKATKNKEPASPKLRCEQKQRTMTYNGIGKKQIRGKQGTKEGQGQERECNSRNR